MSTKVVKRGFDELFNRVICRAIEVHWLFGPRLSDIKLADVQIRLLINFNNTRLKDGIKRFVL